MNNHRTYAEKMVRECLAGLGLIVLDTAMVSQVQDFADAIDRELERRGKWTCPKCGKPSGTYDAPGKCGACEAAYYDDLFAEIAEEEAAEQEAVWEAVPKVGNWWEEQP